MPVTIVDDKKLWNKLKSDVTKSSLGKKANSVDLGLFEEQGQDLVNYAAINEFHLQEVSLSNVDNVIGRSFLRRVYDEEKKNIIKMLKAGLRGKSGKSILNIRFALNFAGNFYLKKLRNKIKGNFYKINFPNTDNTIARKGSDKPLIDTTRMITSFTKRFSSVKR